MSVWSGKNRAVRKVIIPKNKLKWAGPLLSISTIANEQTTATEKTERKVLQLLNYLATHPAAKLQYRVSDMILNIHSDASYLSETRGQEAELQNISF